jgi:CBS domain containing-hemolysin-like protein
LTLVALFLLLVLAALLVLATTVQTCYLESLRLRKREQDALLYFEEHVEDELAVSDEIGALSFSLWKHTLLVLLPVSLRALSENLALVAVYSLIGMLGLAYLLPQFLYRRTSGAWMRTLIPGLRLMVKAARPVISLLSFMKTVSEFGEDQTPPEEKTDEAHALIDAGAEEGLIAEDDKKLLKTVIDFGEKVVREVMTPRPNIVAISEDKTLEELRQLVISEQYSRIPVFKGNLDNIQGFVHVRDMFEVDYERRLKRKVREIMRPLDPVPETKPVDNLLREMQRDGKHMVLVVDEYGGTAGLVTMEDLVEEIFGEIRDEHEPAHDFRKEPGGAYVMAGTYDLDHLKELVSFEPSNATEATTVGGLVTEWFGYVPSPGEVLEREGIRIEVLASSDLRVDKVRLAKLPASNGHG